MTVSDGRASGPYDQERAEKAVRELLIALGEDPEREGLKETPARVARAMKENFEGLWQSPEDVLTTTFDIGHEELVIVRDIEVFSHCEHHLTPFHGVAHIGYIPRGKITGLSKLARLVDLYAKRPQVQERLTRQIAEALMEGLGTSHVAVYLEADHMCVKTRGIEDDGSSTITMAFHGKFEEENYKRLFLESFK
ncbi:MAG: GTP cyclohydrolase I FolE [Flavobacteriia bacterium]|nr:GTP cyclohydrolase I FolE [Flavobacteriia bacterium]